MKRIIALALIIVLTAIAAVAGTEPVAPSVAAASIFQSVITWMQANQVVVGLLIAAVLDFIFAINPEWKSNGALHFIYTIAKGKSGQGQQQG